MLFDTLIVLAVLAAAGLAFFIVARRARPQMGAPRVEQPSTAIETVKKLPLYVNGQKVGAATVTSLDFDKERVRIEVEALVGVGDVDLLGYLDTGESVELDVVIAQRIYRSVGTFSKCSMVYDWKQGGALRGTFRFYGTAFDSGAGAYVKTDGAPHLARMSNGEILPVVVSPSGQIHDAETKQPISSAAA